MDLEDKLRNNLEFFAEYFEDEIEEYRKAYNKVQELLNDFGHGELTPDEFF